MKTLLFALILSFLVACQPPSSPSSPVPGPSAAQPSSTPGPSALTEPTPGPTEMPDAPAPSVSPKAQPSPQAIASPQTALPLIAGQFVGQLFYQLDCISGQPNCTSEDFLTHWQSLGFKSADQAKISQWRNLKSKYNVTRRKDSPNLVLAEPLVFQTTNVWQSIRAASLSSSTLSNFDSALTGLIATEDRTELLELLDYFSKSFFEAWWQNSGQSTMLSLLKDYQVAFETHQLGEMIENINRFYRGQPSPLSRLHFHLMLQAPGTPNVSLAEQILNHGVIEVSSTQSPKSNLDVMLHEMTHFLFKELSPDTQARIQGFFAKQPEPDAMSAYHLFDESMATAFGNGLVNQKVLDPGFFQNMLQTPRSFFNDAFIDAYGKLLFDPLGESLKADLTVDSDAFLQKAYDLANEQLNLSHPIPALRHSAVYLDTDNLRGVLPELQGRLSPWSLSVIIGGSAGPGFFQDHSRLNGVLYFDSDLSNLEAWRQLIGEAAYTAILNETRPGFVYGLRTARGRRIYVFKTPDLATASDLLMKLLGQTTHVDGFLFP